MLILRAKKLIIFDYRAEQVYYKFIIYILLTERRFAQNRCSQRALMNTKYIYIKELLFQTLT